MYVALQKAMNSLTRMQTPNRDRSPLHNHNAMIGKSLAGFTRPIRKPNLLQTFQKHIESCSPFFSIADITARCMIPSKIIKIEIFQPHVIQIPLFGD